MSYRTPSQTTKSQVTFTVTNSDGAVSGASNALTVDPALQVSFQPQLTSATSTFKVQTGAVAPTAPADGATVNPTDLTFQWSDFLGDGGQGALEARNYDVQIATDADFDNIVEDVSTIDMTQFTPTTAQDSGTYFWRVAAVDESGHLLAWSDSRSVTVDGGQPKVSIATKAGAPITGSVTINSSEPLRNVVTGANSPSFALVPSSGGAAVTGRVIALTGRRWQLRPDTALVTGESYALQLGAGLTDAAGNQAVVTGSALRTTLTADNTSRAWHAAGHWTRHSSSRAMGGTYATARRGAANAVEVAGAKVTLYGCKAPRYGTETVSVDGAKVASVSLSHRYTECGVRLWSGKLTSGVHSVKVSVSKGTGDIDELAVTRAR